jgi:hypothetical protein
VVVGGLGFCMKIGVRFGMLGEGILSGGGGRGVLMMLSECVMGSFGSVGWFCGGS